MTWRIRFPETKRYLFIKLPDRIVFIDPDTNMVAGIVGAPATTGARTRAMRTRQVHVRSSG